MKIPPQDRELSRACVGAARARPEESPESEFASGWRLTDEVSGTPDYTMGYGEEYLQALLRVSATTHAAHLLPHLEPGFRVLDFGCGPGTISIGLAEAVAPGEVHGVDMEASQIDLARMFAKRYGRDNAVFHVGDVTDLPFEDDSFDVAHCHNVLMHVPDTQAVLREVNRVVKPGGIIASREMISGSSFTHPDFEVLRNAWDMFEDLLEADDGHPQMGKDLKTHFVEAGLTNYRVSASFDTFTTPDEITFIHQIAQQWFLAPEITEAAIKYGAATEALCDHIGVAYDRWKDHPGAFAAVAYGELLAWKPES